VEVADLATFAPDGIVVAPAAGGRTRRVRWLSRRHALVVAGTILALAAVLAYVVPVMLVVEDLTTPDRRPPTTTPAEFGLAYEDIAFSAQGEDVTLRGWWIPGVGPQAAIVVHGVNGVRDDPTDGFLRLGADLHRLGYHVLLFDLRGHGESDSAPFVLGALEWQDVLGAVDVTLARGVPAGQIAVIGFSTGAAAGLEAAVRDPAIGAVVADGVWPELTEVLDDELPDESDLPAFYNPGIYLAVRLLYGADVYGSNPIEDVRTLAAAGRPLFLIHEAEDSHTDAAEARRLDEAAAGAPQVETWWVEGAKHVRAYATYPDEYLDRLGPFLAGSIGAPAVTDATPEETAGQRSGLRSTDGQWRAMGRALMRGVL
jgi:pimeloyl-ACP methyl ester carboxylesterase